MEEKGWERGERKGSVIRCLEGGNGASSFVTMKVVAEAVSKWGPRWRI